MAQHIVICKLCQKKFDLNSEQGVKINGSRYAHLSCAQEANKPYLELVPMEKSATDPDFMQLKDYINKILGEKANWPSITKQIKKYKEEDGYTYSGMLKSLIYFYDIKHNPVKTNNVAIIPYIYKDAKEYYYNLFVIQQQAEQLEVNHFKHEIKEITIPIPKFEKRKKLFDLEEEEDVSENEDQVL